MSLGIKTTWGMYLKCRFLGSSPGPTEPDFPGLTLESFFFFFLKIQKMLTYLTIGLHIEKAGGIPFLKCEGGETVQLSTKIKSSRFTTTATTYGGSSLLPSTLRIRYKGCGTCPRHTADRWQNQDQELTSTVLAICPFILSRTEKQDGWLFFFLLSCSLEKLFFTLYQNFRGRYTLLSIASILTSDYLGSYLLYCGYWL